jgi:hypothetical protein
MCPFFRRVDASRQGVSVQGVSVYIRHSNSIAVRNDVKRMFAPEPPPTIETLRRLGVEFSTQIGGPR